jgi:hypothetical protein
MEATFSLAKAWKADAERTSKYGAQIAKLSRSIQTLVTVEAPDSMPVITPTLELLEKWAAVNADVAASKLRISNDVRDLVERYRVVERVTDQRKSAATALESAKAKLSESEDEVAAESKRKDYNLKKAEANLAKLRIVKKEALIRARDLTVLLIQERKKFSSFVFRRTRDAYTRLGATFTRDSPLELAILMRLIEALQKARAGEILQEVNIEVPVIVPLSFADDDGGNDGPIEASLILPEEATPPEAPKEIEPAVVAVEPPIPQKHGSVFESTLFDGLVTPAKPVEAERPRSIFADESAPKRGKLFDVAEIEAHIPKAKLPSEPAEDGWAGVEVQPIDEGKALFEVEMPPELPPQDGAKPKAPTKKGPKKGKKARATPSPFDDI